jgi:hypothetical protein
MQQQWRLLLADRSERNRATQHKHPDPDMNVIVVFFLLVDSPESEFLYADVSEHSVPS